MSVKMKIEITYFLMVKAILCGISNPSNQVQFTFKLNEGQNKATVHTSAVIRHGLFSVFQQNHLQWWHLFLLKQHVAIFLLSNTHTYTNSYSLNIVGPGKQLHIICTELLSPDFLPQYQQCETGQICFHSLYMLLDKKIISECFAMLQSFLEVREVWFLTTFSIKLELSYWVI